MADIKSMTLEQAKAYRSELKSQGKTASTSKEYGKVEDYIATLQPENYGEERVAEAYSKLSRGVTTTGGWTEQNLDNIERYTGVRPTLYSPQAMAEGDLSAYLSNYQSSVYGSAGAVELRDQITAQLEPDMPKPEPLSRVAEFERMRSEMGVADLEGNLNQLKAQLEEQYAIRRERTQTAEGARVPLGVIAGRVTEIERQEQERIDAIGREINVISDQLTTAYNVISTYINFMGLDYQDAVNAYNTEYQRNLQVYQLVDAEMDQQRAEAKSNLQIYQNAILQGNLSYNSLSSDQKAFINKLEIQSGLPTGITSSLQMSAKDRILTYNSDNTEALILGENGEFKVISTGLTKASTAKTAEDIEKYITENLSDGIDILKEEDIKANNLQENLQGNYEYTYVLSPEAAQSALNRAIGYTGDTELGENLFNRSMNASGYTIEGINDTKGVDQYESVIKQGPSGTVDETNKVGLWQRFFGGGD